MESKTEGDNSKVKRKTVRTTIEVKKVIISEHENGVRVSDLALQYGMPKSTICTILKNKVAIKEADVAKGVKVLTKQRPKMLEQVEKILLTWINERQLAGDRVSEGMICDKARQLRDELSQQNPNASADAYIFKASKGWFQKFKRRSGLFRETANKEVVDSYVEDFTDYAWKKLWPDIVEDGHIQEIKSEPIHANDIVSVQSRSLKVDNPDLDYRKNLTTEDLIQLHREKLKMVVDETPSEPEEDVPTSLIYEMCDKWFEVQSFVERYHPDKKVTNNLINLFNDSLMSHFRIILRDRQIQADRNQSMNQCLDELQPESSDNNSMERTIPRQTVIHPVDTQPKAKIVQKRSKEIPAASDQQMDYEDEASFLGKIWALDFKRLEPDQQLFAKKAINDIFFEARQGTLNRQSVHINVIGTLQSASAEDRANNVDVKHNSYSNEMNTWKSYMSNNDNCKERNGNLAEKNIICIKDEPINCDEV